MKALITLGTIALGVYYVYDWEIFSLVWDIVGSILTFAICMVLSVLSKILGG